MANVLQQDIHVVNIGISQFVTALEESGTPHVALDWRPPAKGDHKIIDLLFRLRMLPRDADGFTRVDRANAEAARRIMSGQPVLMGVKPARDVIPGMTRNTILHAGPPIEWKDMCGPMRGAFIGAAIYEGLAATQEEAVALMDSGAIIYGPNHHHDAVGPMTGMISWSMPVFVVRNENFGNTAYCTINEGIGKVMRFGANGPEVIERLKWLRDVLAPALDEAVAMAGGVNLKNILAQSLAMGDEMHQRNVAASLNFYKQICGELAEVVNGNPQAKAITEFVARRNEQFFLNLAMATAKVLIDPARDIPHSSIVTAMSRNGVDFGINVSALKERWFTAPCLNPQGMYFPGYSEADANPDMGDSAIVECIGIGGMAMAAAPAVVSFVGAGSVSDAVNYSESMGEITQARNPELPMPTMDFAGAATGIDIRKVVETGILPVINTGIAHREPGVGQVGAGIVTPPMDIMVEALEAFVRLEEENQS